MYLFNNPDDIHHIHRNRGSKSSDMRWNVIWWRPSWNSKWPPCNQNIRCTNMFVDPNNIYFAPKIRTLGAFLAEIHLKSENLGSAILKSAFPGSNFGQTFHSVFLTPQWITVPSFRMLSQFEGFAEIGILTGLQSTIQRVKNFIRYKFKVLKFV